MTTQVVNDEKLGVLARRQNDLFRRVREGTLPIEAVLRAMQDVIEGNFDAIPVGLRRLIDCDAMPYIPKGWRGVQKHVKGGEVEFDQAKVRFYQSFHQQTGEVVILKDLIAETEGNRRGNACILDHLLANTNLLSDSWKFNEDGSTRNILFVDTEYLDGGGNVFVRCLCWDGGQWIWGNYWVDDEVGAQYVVFILGE